MDFSELDDALEEDTYIPTFNKAPRTNNKPLTRNNSSKSIDNSLPTPPPPPRTNLLQIHKETRKEVMTFEDLLKNQKEPTVAPPSLPEKRPETVEKRPEVKEVRFEPPKEAKKPAKPSDNYWNDEQDDAPPIVAPNRMKPPIIRRADDNRSVASRRNDDNRSVTSNADFKRKEDLEPFNNLSAPQPTIAISLTPPASAPNPLEQTREIKREPIAYPPQIKQVSVVADTSELKKMLEEQLQLQRQFTEKIMKEEQENHKKQVEKLKELHAQEMARKLDLKNLELEKLKEFYEMQLKARGERADELKELQLVNRKVEEGLKALSRAEQELRNKGSQYQQDIEAKLSQNKLINDFASEKQNHVQQLYAKLEIREKQFKDERQRGLAQLDRERRKLQEAEAKLYRRERELQEKYFKKERQLIEQYDEKQRKLAESESQVRLKKMELEQQRLRVQQEREEGLLRQRKAEQSRTRLMEELQAERVKLATKEMEISSRSHEWQAKENELLMKEKEVAGRFKLIELERKRVEVERDMKRRPGLDSKIGLSFDKTEIGPSPLEKSIKQLKDQYLRNLGHI